MRGMIGRRSLLAASGLALLSRADAQTPATLRIGLADAVTSVDPHFYNTTPNHNLAIHLFDRLVDRSPQAQPIPGTATQEGGQIGGRKGRFVDGVRGPVVSHACVGQGSRCGKAMPPSSQLQGA